MILYIVKTVLCSGLLLAVYRLLLQTEKMHRFNRMYLLLGVLFSLLVPLVTIEGEQEILPFAEPPAELRIHTAASQPSSPPYRLNRLLLIYGTVSLVLLFRFAKNFAVLLQRAGACPASRYDGVSLVLTNSAPVPYSFLRWIFVNKEAFEKGEIEEEILQHELAHVKQGHSLDVLLMELVLVFTWFNPFFYGFRKAVRLNHEFLADAAVIASSGDLGAYQQLLLKKLSLSPASALSSPFNFFTLKKRLIMMTKQTSPKTAFLKQVIVFPLLALLVFVFSTKPVVAQPQKQPAGTEAKPQKKTDSSKAYRYKTFFTSRSIGSTKEGASPEQLKEYEALAEENFPPGKSTPKNWEQLSKENKAKMESLFRQMTTEQQLAQYVFFVKPAEPLSKAVPSKQQLENFKNASTYGLWIDERKIPNSSLNNYVNTDFSQVFVSKLYGAAKKGKSYTHQVDLMTNAYYENYVKETKAKKESGIAIKWPIKEKE